MMESTRRDVTVLVPLSKGNPDKEENLRKCPTVQVKNVIFDSIHEKENLMDYVQRLKKVVSENNVSVVLPTSDVSTFVHAALARDFAHIPGPSVESCYLAFHKPYTRQHLDLGETPTAYDVLDLDSPTLFQDAERALEKVGLPAFVKSATATLAYGLKKIENYDDLKDALEDFKTMRDKNPDCLTSPSAAFYRDYFKEYLDVQKYPLALRDVVLVEPFLDAETLCTADGCVVDGKLVHWTITDELQYDGHEAKFTSMLGPTNEPQDIQTRMWRIYDRIMDRMIQAGFNDGYTNIEIFKMKDGTLRLCEVNARGSRLVQGIYKQVYRNANQDYVYLSAGTGIVPVTPPPTGRHGVAYMAKFLGLERPGNLMDFDKITQLKSDPDVHIEPYFGRDDAVPDIPGSAGCDICSVVAFGNDRRAMMKKLVEVLRLIVKKPERLAYPVSEENMMSILY
ncbi:PREDICTED: uncharacterized protein LOC109479052 [Branchiostoma belcheri]|uniref:Uncharacterized protein LOC109479052 n=1 Tax=Branchiostoma belcheri TaxID=7741 RepID=A0A6P4Z4R1_BRABE|nr:PREDICTED: uncharacterized protein LOC109479052 [Branchiostoma belcheri]